jgi:hypothetical protein
MNGVWFAVTVTALVIAGVVAQLGWQLPEMAEVKRVFRLDRQWLHREPARPAAAAVIADPR